MQVNSLIVGSLLAALLPSSVYGYATYRSRFPNGFSVQHPCDANKIWQGVGHHSDQGGNERNQFGLDFAAAGHTWTRTLCEMDSDGDGLTNGEELGDPQCTWSTGQTPSRTTKITHPGFKTPVQDNPHNESDPTSLDCSTFFQRCPAFDDPDVRYIDLQARNGSNDTIVPAKETTYYNMIFQLPSDKKYHAVGFKPLLDNLEVIHHFGITSCRYPVPVEKGFESFNPLPGCEEGMYVWSFGMGEECLVEEAGVPFGGEFGTFVQLQLHWTNKDERPGHRDMSGVRMFYTSKLRRHDLGSISTGQLSLNIPPQQAFTSHKSTCNRQCTNALLDQGPIKVTAGFPHMHFLGKSLYVDHIKRNGQRSRILNDKVYNYNSPVTYHYRPNPLVVSAGDELITTCVFNSEGRANTTRWGFGSFDEMCFAFFRYYPRRGDISCVQFEDIDFCLTSNVNGPNCSVFGYSENVTATVNGALRQCEAVTNKVLQPNPPTQPVCTKPCHDQISRVMQAYRSPCQQTRHKQEWQAVNNIISKDVASLEAVENHCKTVGVINDSRLDLEGSGAAPTTQTTSVFFVLTALVIQSLV